MKILYVASECAPYAASGGLGDVIGALPKCVAATMPRSTVEVIIPLYDTVMKKYEEKLSYVRDVSFSLSWRSCTASIYKIHSEGVCCYFVRNPYYFNRGALYGEYDDAERFAFFSAAVIAFIKSEKTPPSVIHANDWQCGLIPIYLKTIYSADSRLCSIKTLFTIHNIEYQGNFDASILGDVFGIGEEHRALLEHGGRINLMKGAICAADYVNTVSPNYANELRYDYFAFGLADIISAHSNKTTGVINGIDYDVFSPETDTKIYKNYTSETSDTGKRENKLLLQEELGFEINPEIALIIMVTRLTETKGIDLVIRILDELLCEGVQLAILGSGDKKYENELLLCEARQKNLRVKIGFDRDFSKKMYAGADIFLMPSRSEPCGLSQLIACSYGCIPIVRSVGGLYDTIIPYAEENANGFRFDNYNAHELLWEIKRALAVYKDPGAWGKIVKRAMESDFSWNNSAKKYISIYKKLCKKERK